MSMGAVHLLLHNVCPADLHQRDEEACLERCAGLENPQGLACTSHVWRTGAASSKQQAVHAWLELHVGRGHHDVGLAASWRVIDVLPHGHRVPQLQVSFWSEGRSQLQQLFGICTPQGAVHNAGGAGLWHQPDASARPAAPHTALSEMS